jgi:serine/threonine-protein kinase HipA
MSFGAPTALRVDLQEPSGSWVEVGVLERWNETTSFSSFEEYWELPHRPVLGQVFEQRGPLWRPAATTALPIWFSNLLPEGVLREAIALDTGVNEKREFPLLARIGGDDLPGAVRMVVVDPGNEYAEVNLEEEDPEGSEDEYQGALKFSLDGVQLKFSVSEQDRGLTVPAHGDAGTWIAKLPDRRRGYEGVPEAEFAALELAGAIGIPVPRTRLVDVRSIGGLPGWAAEGGGSALLIHRFDRRPGGRVHVEELSQVLNRRPARKYKDANFETVARVTAALAGPERVAEVIDRIVLNVLVGNGDAHVKNWAYTYPDGRSPELSPAYDIVPTVLYMPDDNLGLNLNGSKSFSDVDLNAFQRLAEKAGWDGELGKQQARDAADRVFEAWPVFVDHLPASAADRLTERRDTLGRLLRRQRSRKRS